jgi:hypothetical protein
VATPSVVELHVNGRMVRQEQVQPGRLDLRNLPLTSGHNDARVVIRDAFGGTQELSTTYYMTSSVLAPGLQDYQYSVGMARGALGYASWNYETPVALARHRIGLTDSLTAGGHFEMGRGVVNAGPGVNVRLPFGEIEGAAGREPRGHAARAGGAWFVHVFRPHDKRRRLHSCDEPAVCDGQPHADLDALEHGDVVLCRRAGERAGEPVAPALTVLDSRRSVENSHRPAGVDAVPFRSGSRRQCVARSRRARTRQRGLGGADVPLRSPYDRDDLGKL